MDEKLNQVLEQFEQVTGATLKEDVDLDQEHRFGFVFLKDVNYVYVVVPSVVLFILVTWKPYFLYEISTSPDSKESKTFSWLRLAVFTIIFSSIIAVALQYIKNRKILGLK